MLALLLGNRLKVILALVLTGVLVFAAVALLSAPAPADAALVFGNTVERSGEPSPRLAARLEAARRLYIAKQVRYVVVSGGFGKEGFDEAHVMADWLHARGIPESALILDSYGTDTRVTCANARRLLAKRNVKSVNVVTQWFHVPRARLAAARAGLDVRGAAWPRYCEPRDAYSFARELVAYPVYALRN